MSESVECEGFCDLQVNGFAGIDFNDPALTDGQIQEAAARMERTGVTRFLATLISAPLDRFAACARVVARSKVPAVAGIHMEGPYISPEDGARGAHNLPLALCLPAIATHPPFASGDARRSSDARRAGRRDARHPGAHAIGRDHGGS